MIALGAAVALIFLPSGSPRETQQSGPLSVNTAWPGVTQASLPGPLADGPSYEPVYFLDVTTSVGTTPSPDGTHLRLVLRASDGTLRELRRLPMDHTPQYGGFAYDGETLAWAEATSDESGAGHTRLWTINLDSGQPARQLTTDTGDIAFFNSQHDMLLQDGRLHWIAIAPGNDPATEIRSTALTGGKVTIRRETGAWALTRWPWVISAGSEQSGPVQLRDIEARKVVTVPAGGTELATCSPTWCRVLVLASDGPARIDLMRPDGTDRRRMAPGTAAGAVVDVAILDRFEVLSQSGAVGLPTSSQELLVYDIKAKRMVSVATGAGAIRSRGGVLWWSTGEDDTLRWHTLDLRTIP